MVPRNNSFINSVINTVVGVVIVININTIIVVIVVIAIIKVTIIVIVNIMGAVHTNSQYKKHGGLPYESSTKCPENTFFSVISQL